MEAIAKVITDVIPSAMPSPGKPTMKPSESTPSGGLGGTQKGKPKIVPRRFPRDILAQILQCPSREIFEDGDYQTIVKHLLTWKKLQMNWDEYRNKLDPILLDKWARILAECGREGFLLGGIAVEDGITRIRWMQRVEYVLPSGGVL